MLRSLLHLVFFATLTAALSFRAFAQDPQYSQYYAAPLYLNPAMAGGELTGRVGFNYRNQWPSIDAQFTTFSAYYDTYLPDYNSGIGFHVMQDTEGAAKLRSTSISAMYSYELKLGENSYFRPGFQASYIRREIGFYENLVFANQINPSDPFGPTLPGSDIPGLGDPVGLLSLSVGGLFFTENMWAGVSAHHVNEPNQSFIDGISPLPMKLSFHAGYRIDLGEGSMRGDFTHMRKQRSLTPTVNYKMQGPFEQLDLGAYLYLEPIVFGLWYRGLPYKPVENQSNRDAVVMMVGVNLLSGLNIGYSFDYTVSQLGIQSGGAHELSLSWTLPNSYQGKPSRRDTILPCPKF
ncbi:type IX secretion system PorP/SprF family membrane protein [Algoriphagus boseongensis]|uniref:Type IX secretion system PorP/SprF family membrane protein n=1 Tax=Algoriphagus boseongensis TaxID=1442587 RepID=A0A4R6T5U4_9BACT|nr:type IX secretion system membrane protein PorP/SprF [Algoriphagus boseongensis]TDQ15047.1 type IX secretion system PorP/SprF family membrane protein [Algoriphagus boseongensis]